MPQRVMRFFLTLPLALALLLPSPSAKADDARGFGLWLPRAEKAAIGYGIHPDTWDAAADEIRFLPDVIRLDRKQPEKTRSFEAYAADIVSAERVKEGRRLMAQHKQLLARVSAKTGVPAKYIVALWGLETHYGKVTGKTPILAALATLSYEGRRRDFFFAELINALKMIEQGHISPEKLKGSWAGAMGQCQFMPSSFLKYAVDGNADGRIDIWTSLPDVFASIANYLKTVGWTADQTWGRQVRLPKSFTQIETDLTTTRPLRDWHILGVRTLDGTPLPQVDQEASLVLPDGKTGRAFLVYSNYRVLMDWNRSTYFATAVGLLADQLGQ